MNFDAFEASETIERTPSGNTADEIREVARRAPRGLAHIVDNGLEYDPVAQDTRLKACGLVWYENQLDGSRWVGPPATLNGGARVKILPLYMVKPGPGLEIEAIDGEKYLLEKTFHGTWFEVTSPLGVKLIN